MSTVEKFIIDIENLSWAIIAADGQLVQMATHDTEDGLAHISDGREIIVIVPPEDVLLTSCKLPKMNTSKLRTAIPFALEDQVIDDVDTLHFAFLQQQQNSGDTIVFVITHEKMQSWLARLNAINIKADTLLPKILTLPDFSAEKLDIVVAENIMIRTGEFLGFACDRANISFYLENMTLPQNIIVHNYTQTPLLLDQEIEENFFPAERYIGDLALNAAKITGVNLLQGRYAVKTSKFTAYHKLGKIASYLAMVWAAFLLIYPLGSYFILKSRLTNIDMQIAQIYKQQFPQATSVVAPKLRIQEKLSLLKTKQGQDGFLSLLARVSEAMQDESHIKLQRLDFQNNQLNLRISAASSYDISTFSDNLIKQGLSVKQQNATVSGTKIHAVLQIE